MNTTFDDADYPAYTMGRAADMIGVTPAFLRSLGTAGLIAPERSHGGHRRYSRHQLQLAVRVRQLLDEGMLLTAACRIVTLEDRLAAAHRRILALGGELTSDDDADMPTQTHDAEPTHTHDARPTHTHDAGPTHTHDARPTHTHDAGPAQVHDDGPAQVHDDVAMPTHNEVRSGRRGRRRPEEVAPHR